MLQPVVSPGLKPLVVGKISYNNRSIDLSESIEEATFECPYCDEDFKSSSSLQRHVKWSHKEDHESSKQEEIRKSWTRIQRDERKKRKSLEFAALNVLTQLDEEKLLSDFEKMESEENGYKLPFENLPADIEDDPEFQAKLDLKKMLSNLNNNRNNFSPSLVYKFNGKVNILTPRVLTADNTNKTKQLDITLCLSNQTENRTKTTTNQEKQLFRDVMNESNVKNTKHWNSPSRELSRQKETNVQFILQNNNAYEQRTAAIKHIKITRAEKSDKILVQSNNNGAKQLGNQGLKIETGCISDLRKIRRTARSSRNL